MQIAFLKLKPAVILISAALMLFASACGDAAQPAAQDRQPASSVETPDLPQASFKVETSAGGVKVEYSDKDGAMSVTVDTEKSVPVPDSFPKDIVPLYPGGRVMLAAEQSGALTVCIQTGDGIDEIFRFYDSNVKLDSSAIKQNFGDTAQIMGSAGKITLTIIITENTEDETGGNLITIIAAE